MSKALEKEIFRVLDANFNRSREGLRVCEDVARFVMNSADITRELKYVRHGISGILKNVEATGLFGLVDARDSVRDIGKYPMPSIEVGRGGIADIFIANLERAKESIRVLEEFFKLIDPGVSRKFTILRFKAYDIEKRAVKKIKVLHHIKYMREALA